MAARVLETEALLPLHGSSALEAGVPPASAKEAGRSQCEVATEEAGNLQRRKASAVRLLRLTSPFLALAALLLVGWAAYAALAPLGSSRRPAVAEERGVAELEGEACSVGRMNCNETRCCSGPGLACYQQDDYYAQCRSSCAPGPDPTHWDHKPWSCKKLGERTAGSPVLCSKPGEDCSESQCCEAAGFQCYQKNSNYATCKVDCAPRGPDLSDTDGEPWTCKELGERAPGAAPWVAEKCSSSWENCMSTKCCKSAGQQCYMQNNYYGACKAVGSCPASEWACNTSGSPTPNVPMAGGKLSPWVFDQCSKLDESCTKSKCCLGMDVQCYEKSEFYAQCRRSCEPGEHSDDKNATWSCRTLGPRSYGLAIKGFPSLFCFAVTRTEGYEKDLMKAQHERGAGIFDCDHFTILTADGKSTIDTVRSVEFAGAPIVTSVDNTAGNTELFVHAWKQIVAEGTWRDHAFTVKADPDAVFIPQRLRWHLAPHVGKNMFIVNCPLWNMIYGALEVFSFKAIEQWSWRGHLCQAPANYGEDKYMTNCMDFLNVMRVNDDKVLGDMLCHTFTSCDNPENAAFHPFKDITSWMQCWDQAQKTDAR